MPKILHIGGANSPHVLGVIEQVKKHTNFKQILVSYPTTIRENDKSLLSDVPTYYYNYSIFFTKNILPASEDAKILAFVKKIIAKEKPDIIHGHYLSKCSVIMSYFMEVSKKPGIVNPWSPWDIPKMPEMIKRNKKCVDLCAYVMCNHPKFLGSLLDFFKKPRTRGVFAGPPIRLYLYKDSIPNVDVPRLLITRTHYQEFMFKALPPILEMFPTLEVMAQSPAVIIKLAGQLNISNRVKFITEILSQEDFSDIMKQHNIIRSMAPDQGNSGTTMQAAYSGAITLVNKTPWDFLEHNVNVIKCDLTVADMRSKLIYAIENLKTLCPMFKENNKFIEKWDAENTWKNLFEAYNSMVGKG